MKLFELQNNIPVITLEAIMIPEFKALYERKDIGFRELQYVYFMTDYKSLYLPYSPADRENEIIKDFIKIPAWKPDAKVKAAIDKYKALQKTESLGLLEDARFALEKIRGYYRSIDFEKRDVKGNQLFKINDVTKSIADISKMIESLEKLKDKVQREEEIGTQIRGGGSQGLFENS